MGSPAVRQATKSWPFGGCTNGLMWCVVLQFLWVLDVVFACMGGLDYSISMFGSALYVLFAGWLSLVRREIRKQWNIPRGDFLTDFISTFWLYFLVLPQLEIEMKEEMPKKEDKEMAAVDTVEEALNKEANDITEY